MAARGITGDAKTIFGTKQKSGKNQGRKHRTQNTGAEPKYSGNDQQDHCEDQRDHIFPGMSSSDGCGCDGGKATDSGADRCIQQPGGAELFRRGFHAGPADEMGQMHAKVSHERFPSPSMTKDRVAVGKIESWIFHATLLFEPGAPLQYPAFIARPCSPPKTVDADKCFRAVLNTRKIQQLLWISLAAKASKRIRFRPGPSC